MAWLKCPGSHWIWNITIADMHSFLPIFCIILFFVSATAEPMPLDVEHLLHYYGQHGLSVQLITTGNVRIWSSSQADWAFLVTQHIQGLLTAFIKSAMDLQVKLVMGEYCQKQDKMLPVYIIQMAGVECSDGDVLMEALVTKPSRCLH